MKAAWLVLLAGCEAATSDPGLTAKLQVQGAQFRPGRFPAEQGGPATLGLTTRHGDITVGELNEPVRGVLEPAARGVVLGIDGEDGTWLFPAGPADLDTPGFATGKATIGTADDFPLGPFVLRMAASDEAGHFGASATAMLTAAEAPEPEGTLVVGLHWDSTADLDLHVVAPDGEAFSLDPNTYTPPPPGEPVDPEAWKAGGILDHDGNQACHRDARPSEHVVWTMPPMAGDYVVRVDAMSMCADASAAWRVEVYGAFTAEARGVATPGDVELGTHGYGAGVTVVRFTLP